MNPVDIVITVCNRPDLVARCIRSVRSHTGFPFRLIVVNDASDYWTTVWLRDWTKTAVGEAEIEAPVLLESDDRLGYTRSANLGVQAAAPQRHVCLLNSDTVVTPGWLGGLIAVLQEDESIGLVNPASDDPGLGCLRMPPGETVFSVARRLREIDAPTIKPFSDPHGFCLLVRREMLDDVGLFDAGAWPIGYGEETDYWLRGLRQGWTAGLATRSFVHHAVGGSFGKARERLGRAALQELAKRWGRDWRRPEDRRRNAAAVRDLETRVAQDAHSRPSAEKIVFVLHRFGPEGGVQACVEICNELILCGLEATAAVLTPMEKRKPPMSDRLFRPWGFNGSEALVRGLRTSLRKGTIVAGTMGLCEVATQVCHGRPSLRNLAFVQDDEVRFWEDVMVHDADEPPKSRRGLRHMQRCYRLGLPAVAVSEFAAEAYRKHSGGESIGVIPPGVNIEQFRPRSGKAEVKVTAFHRPRHKRRGGAILRALFRLLRETYGSKIELVTVGSADGLDSLHVTCFPELNREEVADLLAESTVLVEPSLYQGFGLPALEAMACGTPVATFDNGGLREYGVHGENVLVASEQTAACLFECVRQLLDDAALRDRLGKAGRETARRFTWRDVGEKWAETIAAATGANG
ncbi:MAG: glycosyltransferase [Candidatus Lernaella stagnicola]|nr:glycosyltransferase [Candidatus Lernaella stagnicola]